MEEVTTLLLILWPEELYFFCYLQQAKVPLNPPDFSGQKFLEIQPQLEKLIEKNSFFHKLIQETYKSSMGAYDSHTEADLWC